VLKPRSSQNGIATVFENTPVGKQSFVQAMLPGTLTGSTPNWTLPFELMPIFLYPWL
jgi:hypothetical protein